MAYSNTPSQYVYEQEMMNRQMRHEVDRMKQEMLWQCSSMPMLTPGQEECLKQLGAAQTSLNSRYNKKLLLL